MRRPSISLSQAKLDYIEEIGMAMESFALPRMAGRVFGALLVAEPAEVDADSLAEMLQASRGSISSSTRLLEQMGLIERISKRGERRDYFRNKHDAWYEAMKKEMLVLTRMKSLAEKGLATLEGDDPEARRGLEEMRDMLEFFEQELPLMFEHWNTLRAERSSEPLTEARQKD